MNIDVIDSINRRLGVMSNSRMERTNQEYMPDAKLGLPVLLQNIYTNFASLGNIGMKGLRQKVAFGSLGWKVTTQQQFHPENSTFIWGTCRPVNFRIYFREIFFRKLNADALAWAVGGEANKFFNNPLYNSWRGSSAHSVLSTLFHLKDASELKRQMLPMKRGRARSTMVQNDKRRHGRERYACKGQTISLEMFVASFTRDKASLR